MTSIPRRLATLGPTIASLRAQTLPATEIRLHLGPECDPNFALEGVTVVRVPVDLGPLTKLSAVTDERLPPETIVVTADDDIVYEPGWLAELVAASQRNSREVWGMSGWNARRLIDHGRYEWGQVGAAVDVIEGWSGVAYRKRFFGPDIMPSPDMYRTVDDVWISAYLHRRNILKRILSRPMCGHSNMPGLHNEKGFVERNRAAAREAFKDEQRPKLSICVPSLLQRAERLARLLEALRAQPRSNEIEILVDIDAGQANVGDKRNRLVEAAIGRYICHFDDDDTPEPAYLDAILGAIEANPGVDAIAIRGRRTRADSGPAIEFDYSIDGPDGEWKEKVMWRSPGHLCPIRSDIAKSATFPLTRVSEDLAWSAAIKPLLKTCARAGKVGEVLYHYQYDPRKEDRPPTHQLGSHAKVFTGQYARRSGPGSRREYTEGYRAFVSGFIAEHGVKSVIDLGCGDYVTMRNANLHGASYLGIDVIGERIALNRAHNKDVEFQRADILTYDLPRTDLILCKDVLQHWSNDDVRRFCDRLKRWPYKFALLTNCNYGPTVNADIETGGWRALDLTSAPFSIGTKVFRWDTKDVVMVTR